MITKRAEKTRRRQRLARTIGRLGSLQLVMNPQTRHLEPLAVQERTALEVAQTVKAVRERQSGQMVNR